MANEGSKTLYATGWPENKPAQLVELQLSGVHNQRYLTLVKDCLQMQSNN